MHKNSASKVSTHCLSQRGKVLKVAAFYLEYVHGRTRRRTPAAERLLELARELVYWSGSDGGRPRKLVEIPDDPELLAELVEGARIAIRYAPAWVEGTIYEGPRRSPLQHDIREMARRLLSRIERRRGVGR